MEQAQARAAELGNPEVQPVHLLLALVEDREGVIPAVLEKIGVPTETAGARAAPDRGETASGGGRGHAAGPEPGAEQGAGAGLSRGRQLQGRVRFHGTPVAGRGAFEGRRGAGCAGGSGRDARGDSEGADGGARIAAGDGSESRGQISGAGKVRQGSDRTGAARQAGPGDRARRGDSPRDPGAEPADQKQSCADRRAGRGQDGHRRRAGAAHRLRRRAGEPEATSG